MQSRGRAQLQVWDAVYDGGVRAPPVYSSLSGLPPTRPDDRLRYSGVDLGQGQLGILLDNVRYTLVRGYVIRDQVNDPMTSPVKARHPTRMHGNGWIDRGLTHNTLA